mmetsp:Transcript_21905/g.43479  ORF Transcript_21905/g.43479 Transcript_21905/m.43479 type:complete len:97 (+) Transcript_21905:332-622(+)
MLTCQISEVVSASDSRPDRGKTNPFPIWCLFNRVTFAKRPPFSNCDLPRELLFSHPRALPRSSSFFFLARIFQSALHNRFSESLILSPFFALNSLV